MHKHRPPKFRRPHHPPKPHHGKPHGPAPAAKHPHAKSSKRPLVEGTLQLKGRIGFVLSEDPQATDILIEGASLRLAMDGDRVRARVLSAPSGGRRTGEIVEVVRRARETTVGVFARRGSAMELVPERDAPPVRITDLKGLHPQEGDLVVVKIHEWPSPHRSAGGVLTEVLGPRNRRGVDQLAVIRKYELPDAFPSEVDAEARQFGEEVPAEAYQGRRTFFEDRVVTIDGADAKDFDDAVHIQRLPNGLWRLGVHIADVAHYVREGTPLDREAWERGTSVYFPGTVIPMLPFNLSDGLCSLRPHVVRLTLSCVMEVDDHGVVRGHEVFESAIRSHRRCTYEEVEAALAGHPPSDMSPELLKDLRAMNELAQAIRRDRESRGSLDFDFPEASVVLGPDGRPVDIRQRDRLQSHRLIEDFMVLANETVARHMQHGPFLYRIHEPPDEEKLAKLHKSLEAVGMPVARGFDSGKPSALQGVLAAAEKHAAGAMIQVLTLRSLKQAVYSPVNAGHYGLGSACYTHFTSPIRRYPDLVVHRLVKAKLHHQTPPSAAKATLAKIAAHTSRRERVAVEAERDYMDVQKVRLMEKHLGETFDGVVSSVTTFGVFVQLNTYFVEGLIHVSNLNDDYYVFDELRMTLKGRRTGRTFAMGQPLRVRLAAANVVKGQLDFELEGSSPPRPRR